MPIGTILGMNAVAFGIGAANTALGVANLGVGVANYQQCKNIRNDTTFIRNNMLMEDTADEMFKATNRNLVGCTERIGAQVYDVAMGMTKADYEDRWSNPYYEPKKKKFRELENKLEEQNDQIKALKRMNEELSANRYGSSSSNNNDEIKALLQALIAKESKPDMPSVIAPQPQSSMTKEEIAAIASAAALEALKAAGVNK